MGKSIGREIYRQEVEKRKWEKDGGEKIAGKNRRGWEILFGGIFFMGGKGNIPLFFAPSTLMA